MERKPVDFDSLKVGDIIYATLEDGDPLCIMDINFPYMLVENLNTHFCLMYHPNQIFK